MKLLTLILALSLVGCASPESYRNYLAAQSAAIKAQKPMLEIIAQDNQPITGLAAIRVYGPGMSIQQEKDNEWVRAVTAGIQVVGVVGGIVAAGDASENLVKAVGGLGISPNVINTDNRTYDNRTNDNHAISNSYNATAEPTIVNQEKAVIVPAQVVNPVIVNPVVIGP